jgi:hypothetical protein
MEQQEDYVIELLNKWATNLVGVQEHNKTRAAQRLEAAFRRSLGQRGDFQAVSKELIALRQEGFFGVVNSGPRADKISECRPGRRSRNYTNRGRRR